MVQSRQIFPYISNAISLVQGMDSNVQFSALLALIRSKMTSMRTVIIICIITRSIYSKSEDLRHTGSRRAYTNHKDEFEKFMCRERKFRLDWRAIMAPCKDHLDFGYNMFRRVDATSAVMSRLVSLDINPTGEYTKFRIKTFTKFNEPKTFGGDSWRVFLHGPANIEPLVYDMTNGEYEIPVLLLEPGTYRADIFLEGTLCGTHVNPPKDWFIKGDYNGHFQQANMWKDVPGWPAMLIHRLWNRIGNGKQFIFSVPAGDPVKINENMQKLSRWQDICNFQLKCPFLSDGYGRWVGQTWEPYVREAYNPDMLPHGALRRRRGTLWIYGDCYAHNLYESLHSTRLCKRQFHNCSNTYNWVYPRWNPDPKLDKSLHRKSSADINVNWLTEYFRKILERPELKRPDSGMLLNIGLHFVRSTPFNTYQTIVNNFLKEIKRHNTSVVWRSTTAIIRPEWRTHKRFQTYQRALLFNAYSMATMCAAGVPVIDVFPMTASFPSQPTDGIHFDIHLFRPVRTLLEKYFKFLPINVL